MENLNFPDNTNKNEKLKNVSAVTFDLSAYKKSIEGTPLKDGFEKVSDIAIRMKEMGGRGLLVGGSVRDLFFGKLSKDFDLEVYGIEYEDLKSELENLGDVSEVGQAFGILKAYSSGEESDSRIDLDVSVPRRESKIGIGHKGFKTSLDKNMTIKEAARRRDFTMNSLSMDPLSGEVFDEFGGIYDIENRILRVTDSETFGDDPLRVLRAMQFAGRFGLVVDDESKKIIHEAAKRLNEISPDRFFEEFQKLFLKSEKPSLGLMTALDLKIFDQFFPHFLLMQETPQEPDWHPEGDVWVHTLMVVDEAAKIVKSQELPEKDKLGIMLAALLHDVGKPETTKLSKDNEITSIGHEVKGEKKAREFLRKINTPKDLEEKVVKLVMNHMMPGSLYRSEQDGRKVTDSAIRRLAKRIHPATIRELVMVSNADSFGRSLELDRTKYAPGEWLLENAKRIGIDNDVSEPLLRGKDLIEVGLTPGKTMGEIIKLGDRIRALDEELKIEESKNGENLNKEEILSLVEGLESNEKAISELRKRAFALIEKIRAVRNEKRETAAS